MVFSTSTTNILSFSSEDPTSPKKKNFNDDVCFASRSPVPKATHTTTTISKFIDGHPYNLFGGLAPLSTHATTMFKSVLVLDNRYIIVNSVVAEYNERRKKVSFLEGAGRGHRGHNIL